MLGLMFLGLIAGILFFLFMVSKFVYKKTGKFYLSFICFFLGFFLFFGEQFLIYGYVKWFCEDDDPLTFLAASPVVGYDLNKVHDFHGPRGCGRQCAEALIGYKFKYAEATVRNPHPIFLTTAPGDYRFYLSTLDDPNCDLFGRYFPEREAELRRDFHYTKVPSGTCIAVKKIAKRTATFVYSSGVPIYAEANRIVSDFPNYRPSLGRSVDEQSGTVVGAVERYYFLDSWLLNIFVERPNVSICTSRRYLRWPRLMQLRDT